MLTQITKMRLPSGVEIALVDWTDRPLFSSVDVQHGFTTQEIVLFSYVIPDNVPGFAAPAVVVTNRTSTAMDTNTSTPGAMASNEEFLVYAIKPEIAMFELDEDGSFNDLDANPTDYQPNPPIAGIKELHRQLILQLTISQKVYAEAPLGYFNTGFGPCGINRTFNPANGAAIAANQGIPSQEAVRSYVIPHHIGGQEKYRVSLLNPTGQPVDFGLYENGEQTLTAMTLRVFLDGLYKRPVS